MALGKISRALIYNDGKLRAIVRALIYSALAFWLFSEGRSVDDYGFPFAGPLGVALAGRWIPRCL